MQLNDNLQILEKICLKIKRTAASKRKCNFPTCKEKEHLKTIPKEHRYRIAVEENVFIPHLAVSCVNHIEVNAWKQVAQLIEDNADYTKQYLEDMFQLLSKPPTKIGEAKESSMYFIVFLSHLIAPQLKY